MIPVFDIAATHQELRAELDDALQRVLASGWFILGREVAAFEEEFAAYVGVRHAVGVASGTDAVTLALRALAIGVGDEVITVAHTAVATVAAIELAGATPVLVDIDPTRLTLNPTALAAAITPRTKAIVPVHLYGQPADMAAIMAIARGRGIAVVEDCAQAHGARLGTQMVGSIGALGAFSFYPTKNLGALGDGGMVTTDDAALAERLRLLRQYGWRDRYVSVLRGMNSRLDEMQAALLRVKLRHLERHNAARRALAAAYARALRHVAPPTEAPGGTHVFHLYVVRAARRVGLQAFLRARGIGTAIHYPVPVHRQEAYRALTPPGGLPHTEAAAGEVLSLPMYPALTEQAAQQVAAAINEFYELQGAAPAAGSA